MNETQVSKKDKNQHIQVFVRVRPINNAEESGRSTSVIEAPSNKEIVIYEKPQDKSSKKFTFDRVFGPTSKQIDVYNAVVSPLLEEVLAGYNCTVFAYGQTGTGKTFTMEGVSADTTLHWQSDTNAGMIPRFLSHLFDELRLLDAQEYTVRVSFLEIYNEELFDLLSASDDGSKIRLYEDASRKGGVIIHGLEEVTVHNKSEVYKILEKGSEKRRTAATLMNANSSRSHTVFSITVHIKENTVGGEDLLKTGKLNLVDLAGSESVGRSGAGDRRAREAANINQSLLTLGRVIIALVERAPHVPYRESKLTRLLQESLGGRTKTSIIATVSPASINLEETLSTLDYAHRAKNITNKPEINQKLSKKALLKEYAEEIERLRKDLAATRERNGVYIAHENYTEMETLIEQQGKEIEEKINHIKALEEAMLNKEKVLNEIHLEYMQQENNLQKAKCDLDAAKHTLKSTDHRLALLEHDGNKQKYLLQKHVAAEKQLYAQVTNLLATADTATDDAQKLHDKIIRMTHVEQRNAAASQRFKNTISGNLTVLGKNLSAYTKDLNVFCENMKKNVDREKKAHITNTATAIESILVGLQGHHSSAVGNLETLVNATYETYKDWSKKIVLEATKNADIKCEHLTKISTELASKICDISESIIVERLRQLSQDLQNKFACVTAYAEEIIRSTSEFRLDEHNELMKSIAEIRSNANEFRQNREKVLQKRRTFAKAMNELFIHFNTLTEHEEESHSLMKNGCNDMDNICDSFKNYVEGSWEKKVTTCNVLEETVQNNMDKIKNGIIAFTEKNEKLSESMTSTVNVSQDDLKTAQVAIKDTAGHYRSLIESSGANLRNEIANNTTTILNITEALNKTVDEVSATHKAFVNQQNTKTLNFYSEINEKLDAQNVKSSAWNNKLAGGLQTMNQQLDKLFIDGMQRDIATGLTPAKRSFSYPREFAITSPHDRILHRFREARKLVETSDEDDNIPLSNEFTIQAIANSTVMGDISTIRITPDENLSTISDITIIANAINAEQHTSALTVNNLNKFSHSCDAIDSCAENSCGKKTPTNTTSISNRDRVLSESELYIKNDNKENTSNTYSKYRKTRSVQSNKLKREKRQVLGTYN